MTEIHHRWRRKSNNYLYIKIVPIMSIFDIKKILTNPFNNTSISSNEFKNYN